MSEFGTPEIVLRYHEISLSMKFAIWSGYEIYWLLDVLIIESVSYLEVTCLIESDMGKLL